MTLVGAMMMAAALGDGATVELLILAGQSNMSGRGALTDLTPAERRADPRILVLANDGRVRVASEPLDDATNQRDPVSEDSKAAVGPGLFAARRLITGTRRRIALLPCAKGGSTLAQWRPATERTTLYGSCLARTRAAAARPAALLWYQGESDSRDAAGAAAWSSDVAALIRRWRSDLARPSLPVVVVALGDPPGAAAGGERYPGWRTIQDAQRRLAIPCLATVTAAALPRNADELHLATAGQRILGTRLAAAVRQLKRRGCG